MQKNLGTAQRQRARDLGVEDFFRRDAGQPAEHGVGHREHGIQAVVLQVAIPHIVRRGREHRHQTAVTQHHRARVVDDETGLEIQPRKMAVGLVGIAGNEGGIGHRGLAQHRVLWAVRRPGGAFGPHSQRLAGGVAGGEVFGQHHQTHVRADEEFGGANLLDHAGDVGGHPLPRSGRVGRAVDGVAGRLQRQRGVRRHGLHALACEAAACGAAFCDSGTPSTSTMVNSPVPSRSRRARP